MPNEEKEQKTPAQLVAEMQAEIEKMKQEQAAELKARDELIAQLTKTPTETHAVEQPEQPESLADRAAKIAEKLNKRR